MSFFSIVVPIFNRSTTIERCIKSVVDQSFTNWELLLVDDGSTDNSVEIISNFAALNSRIKIFQRPSSRKKGANACRNIGIENATGSYIALLDADDEWKRERLKNVWKFLSYSKPKAVYSGGLINNSKEEFKKNSRRILPGESPVDFLLSDDSFAQTSTLVVERSLAGSVKFDEDLQRNQDYDFFIRLHLVENWTFYDNFDVVIHWKKGQTRNHHFDSNITFCETYKNLVQNMNLLYQFYYNYWLIAKKARSDKAEYFLKEMRKMFPKVGIKNKIRFLFKEVFFRYYKVKKVI
ncbi:glycosyltransferase family 2 protein [Negadavirga shengliensis]|uniref:Glycosyltransferase family 2 protein n=1 Tax=Negadavirga shengliensis TaxID=1389218 RepID=A0ABV9T2B7_9BACT